MHRFSARFRRAALAASVAAAVGMGVITGLGPAPGGASSHREAPLVAADPQVDNTDLYAFVSPDDPDTVTIISAWIPFEEPAGGPNFYPFATHTRYEIKVDNDGDPGAEVTYRFVFRDHRRNPNTFLYNTGQVTSLDDPDLNFYQTFDLFRVQGGEATRLLDDAMVVPSHVGNASMPNYAALRSQGIHSLPGGGKAFAGQADDPFYLDLRVFDLLYGANLSEVGDDTLDGFNVNVLAIQVPKEDLARSGDPDANPVIGIWSTASRRSTRVLADDGTVRHVGRWVQVSRLGMPLVNEAVIPVGLKDRWNASRPAGDGQFLPYVNDPEVPHLLNLLYGLPVPDSDPTADGVQRDDLVAVFLTGVEGLNKPAGVVPAEMLRLNMSIPPCEPPGCSSHSRLGVIGGDVAGFPNGRRLGDDVIDIALQVLAGELLGNPNDLGDGVDANDVAFGSTFPYVGLPHSGSDPTPH
jgi:hypothetical protein